MRLTFFHGNEQHLNFSRELAFSNVHLLQNRFGGPEYHNLSLLSFYEIMLFVNFEICKKGNFTTELLYFNLWEILRELILTKKPFTFNGFFLQGIFFKKYVRFTRREKNNLVPQYLGTLNGILRPILCIDINTHSDRKWKIM